MTTPTKDFNQPSLSAFLAARDSRAFERKPLLEALQEYRKDYKFRPDQEAEASLILDLADDEESDYYIDRNKKNLLAVLEFYLDNGGDWETSEMQKLTYITLAEGFEFLASRNIKIDFTEKGWESTIDDLVELGFGADQMSDLYRGIKARQEATARTIAPTVQPEIS